MHLNFRCVNWEERDMKGPVVVLLAGAALLGCAAQQTQTLPTYEVSVPFDQKEASRLVKEGANTVKGNAFMRQQGGSIVTCAGQTVYLIPATAYAKQRMLALYGNTERGVSAARMYYKFIPDPPEYRALMRTSKCDSKGNFVFERVSDGEFFIAVLVSWQVGDSPQGGQLMHRVSVRGGQTSSVVMAP
jgi:hypothetical protein